MAADLDLLVLGDANPDLVLHGGDVVPAFGQAEHLVEDARLTIGGSGAILRVRRREARAPYGDRRGGG